MCIRDSWIAARDRAEVLKAFVEAGAAVAPVFDARDIVEDRHVRETEMLVEVEDDELGSMVMHNVMWRMSLTPGRYQTHRSQSGPRHRPGTDRSRHRSGDCC